MLDSLIPGRAPGAALVPRCRRARDVGDRHDQNRVGAAGHIGDAGTAQQGLNLAGDIADVDHAHVAIGAYLLLRDLETVDVALDGHGRRRRATGHAWSARSAAASAGSGPRAGRWRSPDHGPPHRSRRSHPPPIRRSGRSRPTRPEEPMPVAAPREAETEPAEPAVSFVAHVAVTLYALGPGRDRARDLSTSYPVMRTQASPTSGRYAEAGVDIDAGAGLVDQIAPFARATARAGATAALGGFGGLFDLAACGFSRPDAGRHHRWRRHQGAPCRRSRGASCGRHRPGRHVRQRPGGAGRPAVVLSRLLRHRASSIPPWRAK